MSGSVGDLGDEVRAVITVLEDADTQIRLARNRLADAAGALGIVAQASTPLPAAVELVREAHQRADAGDTAVEEAVGELTAYLVSIGVPPGPHGTHPSVRTAADRPTAAEPSPTDEQKRQDEIAAKKDLLGAALTEEEVRRLLDSLPPKASAGDGVPTMGWLQIRDKRIPIQSGPGKRGEAGVHEDLDYQAAVNTWRAICERVLGKQGASAWDLDTAGHAEIKAAIRQRAAGIRHSSIVINHPDGPCGGHATKCRELLEEFLPPGHTMTIYWPGGSLVATGR